MKLEQTISWKRAKGVCVEVGTWHGDFADALLQKPEVKHLTCVDPYRCFSDEEFPDSCNLEQTKFDSLFQTVSSKLTAAYGDRVSFVRELSKNAAAMFEDESLDYVYIDGNHIYKEVMIDLEAWYPKVKKGGLLCGDDVVSTNLDECDADGNVTVQWGPGCWGKYGVYKALVDFGKPFTLDRSQFCIQKPTSPTV